jgi:hypothetical protein
MNSETLQQANVLDAAIKKLTRALEKTNEIEKALQSPDFHFKFYFKTRDTFSNVGDFTPSKGRFLAYLKSERVGIEEGIEKLQEELNSL